MVESAPRKVDLCTIYYSRRTEDLRFLIQLVEEGQGEREQRQQEKKKDGSFSMTSRSNV